MSNNFTKLFNICKTVGKYSAIGGSVVGSGFGALTGYQDSLIKEYEEAGKVTETRRVIPCENKYIRSLLGGIVGGTVSGTVTGVAGLLFPLTAATSVYGVYNGNIYKKDGLLIFKSRTRYVHIGLKFNNNK